MDVLQWSRHYRCFPGQGGFDLARFLRARARRRLPRAAVAGGLQRRLPRRPTRERMAVDAMRSLLAARGGAARPLPPPRCAATRSPSSRSTRRSGRTRAAADRRWASATPASTAPSRCSCGAHGDARVLVNHERRRRAARGRDRGRERRPDPLGRRAPRRCSRRCSPRERGPGEADLAGGRRARRHVGVLLPHRRRAGLADFLHRRRGRRRTATLHRHRPRRAVAAVRLLRRGGAVLPLGARAGAATTPTSSPRPTGSCAAARRGAPTAACASRSTSRCWPAARRPSSQHVAFATRRRAGGGRRAARARRAAAGDPRQLLRRPRRARRARARALARACASSGVLYDRDAATASCCTSTPRWRARLFFEVLERRGGYDGYGAANAPVRMAAQRACRLAEHTESQGGERER